MFSYILNDFVKVFILLKFCSNLLNFWLSLFHLVILIIGDTWARGNAKCVAFVRRGDMIPLSSYVHWLLLVVHGPEIMLSVLLVQEET